MFFKTLCFVPLCSLLACSASAKSLVDKVNPMIGASTSLEYGEGKTFPGAATPFGLVQLSPDTITAGTTGRVILTSTPASRDSALPT